MPLLHITALVYDWGCKNGGALFYQSMYAPKVYQLKLRFYGVEVIPHLIMRGTVAECLFKFMGKWNCLYREGLIKTTGNMLKRVIHRDVFPCTDNSKHSLTFCNSEFCNYSYWNENCATHLISVV